MAGVSDTENKDVVKQWIEDLEPAKVLDIGAGQGTYSKLARVDDGHSHWAALEVFYPYVNQYELWQYYDEIHIGDARIIDYDKLGDFDLIIAADMLEHMNKGDAKELIDELLDHCKQLLICFPVEHQEQHAGDEGNDFETHVDHWTAAEMDDFLDSQIVNNRLVGNVLAYYLVEGNV